MTLREVVYGGCSFRRLGIFSWCFAKWFTAARRVHGVLYSIFSKKIIMDNSKNIQNKEIILYKEEVYNIVNCAFEVLNTLGHGLLEKPYENALCVEFMARQIPYEQQRNFNIIYKNHKVGEFVPDLIAFGTIVIDTKTIDKITDLERGKILNYLKITGCRVGLILNFKHPILEWARLVP